MDCALFLAKVIYHDLTVANATAWQFWNAWEPGSAEFDSRYYLLALNINAANTDGDFAVTKNLWALGHYSRFIRPGMKRIVVVRKDESDSRKAAQDVMLCAFTGKKELVVVAVNYTTSSRDILLDMPGVKRMKNRRQYVTSAGAEDNMRLYPLPSLKKIALKPRSIITIVISR